MFDPATILSGPLFDEHGLALNLEVRLCDLRSRFISKGQVGRHFRAVARNGRVLFASDLSLEDLVGRTAQVRLQAWRRAILPGDRPEVFGIILCVRCVEQAPLFAARLARRQEADNSRLDIDVGGGTILQIIDL